MSNWKIIREADDPMALRISIGSPQLEDPQDGYIVNRGDTKQCLDLLEKALEQMKKHYEEQGE